jgi:hypothetical protein
MDLQPTSKFRVKYDKLPVVMLPLLLYTDDTSGNQSKKWNSFDVWALLLAGLPRALNAQLHNIHFLCASNRCKAIEMTEPIVADLLKLEEGVVVFDALLKQEVLVVAPVMAILADNPRASEITNHIGNSGNKFCRMCQV